jgi:molybdopterin converting factor small subunit
MPDDAELDFDKAKPVNVNAKKAVSFFVGEAEDKFIENEAINDLVEYAFSLKATLEEVEKKYKQAADEIKKRLDADKMEGKKVVKDFGDRKVILTRRQGSVRVDYEAYIRDVVGEREVKDLETQKDLVKRGAAESKYMTLGKDSISMEIL